MNHGVRSICQTVSFGLSWITIAEAIMAAAKKSLQSRTPNTDTETELPYTPITTTAGAIGAAGAQQAIQRVQQERLKRKLNIATDLINLQHNSYRAADVDMV